MSPEEFEVLTGDNGPFDYSLNQTTMTQFKFNDKYVEAINGRVQREKQQEKAYYANITRQIAQQIDRAKVQNQNDLNDQINQHNADIAQHNNDLANQNQAMQGIKGNHISDKTVNEAVNYQRHTNAANIRASGEVEALNTTAAKTGRGWASVNDIPSPTDDAIHKAQVSILGDVPMGSSTQTYINEFNQSIDNTYKATNSGRIAEAAYQSAGGHAPFDVTQYMDSIAQSMSYSASFLSTIRNSVDIFYCRLAYYVKLTNNINNKIFSRKISGLIFFILEFFLPS